MNKETNELITDLCGKLRTGVDAGILEEIVSLFNNGVLELRLTVPKTSFDNNILTVEQCFRVNFIGKDKIIQQENEITKLKLALSKYEECRAFYADRNIWETSNQFRSLRINLTDGELVNERYRIGGKLARSTKIEVDKIMENKE